MNLETNADILTESHTCLAEAKSCGLTHTLICEALQAEKCWDELEDILQLNYRWNTPNDLEKKNQKIFHFTDKLSLHNMAASSGLREKVYHINFLLKKSSSL